MLSFNLVISSSNIAVGDFGAADLSTAYSAEFTTFSNTGDAQNTIALNSTAISDANTNSELILAVIDLPNLGGSAIIKQSGYDVRTLTEFEGE
mgnify:CR=1 FL=1